MSTDGTREIVQEYIQKDPRIRMIDNPGKIVPTGMNLALRQAIGEIIIRVDGHCVIAPDYVCNCVDHIIREGVDGVGGPMQSIGENKLSETIAIAMSSTFGVGNSAFRTTTGKTRFVDTIPFPAYTRLIIEKAGFYDEELVRNQDDEYNYRIRELGGRLLLADNVRSKNFSRSSLIKLWKQYYQYGFYKVRVLQKHLKEMSLRQFIPPVFVTILLGSIMLSLLFFWGWLVLAATAGSYIAANLAASILAAMKRGWLHLPLLPVAFAIIHLGYGIGFLAGLFKFANRWGDKKGKVPNMVSADV
jgi:glycosyltransferase involved in cell wall biosynthesis